MDLGTVGEETSGMRMFDLIEFPAAPRFLTLKSAGDENPLLCARSLVAQGFSPGDVIPAITNPQAQLALGPSAGRQHRRSHPKQNQQPLLID